MNIPSARFAHTIVRRFVILWLGVALGVGAQEASIHKNLSERIGAMPTIDEVNKTPLPGIFEIRVGSDIYYSDAQGNYLIQGQIIDTRARRNLTQERIDKLTAIRFDALPLQDAITIVRGNGKRKLAVFEDPNCGYCKRFERDLLNLNHVTVHLFLYPILGTASKDKSRNIWCAKDKVKVWQDWMVRDVDPPQANCDASAITHNVELGHRYKITGTPTLFFADGSRIPGVMSADQLDKRLGR